MLIYFRLVVKRGVRKLKMSKRQTNLIQGRKIELKKSYWKTLTVNNGQNERSNEIKRRFQEVDLVNKRTRPKWLRAKG